MLYALDTETTGLHVFHGCRPFLVALISENEKVISFTGKLNKDRSVKWNRKDLLKILSILEDPSNTFVMHNAKFDTRVMAHIFNDYKIPFNVKHFLTTKVHDTAILSHIYNSAESHGLKNLSKKYLHISEEDKDSLRLQINKLRPKYKSLGYNIANEKSCPYLSQSPRDGWWVMDMGLSILENNETKEHEYSLCEQYCFTDVARTIALYKYFQLYLTPEEKEIYSQQLKLLWPVYKTEEYGVSLDTNLLDNKIQELKTLYLTYELELKKLSNCPWLNTDSPKQIGEILYNYFDLPVLKFTDKGGKSTDKETLEKLIELESLGEKPLSFLNYLLSSKKVSTTLSYLQSYKRLGIQEGDLTILHPSLNITGTSTTRMSSSDPNEQNISKGKDAFLDKLNLKVSSTDLSVRKLFVPRRTKEWLIIDGKQLQLAIFANCSGDSSMVEAIKQGKDFHDFMARRIFNVPNNEQPESDERRIAKNVNFGFIFGAGEHKIDSTARIKGLYSQLRSMFPKAIQTINANKKFAEEHGCINIHGYNLYIDSGFEYAATNYIVQGYEGLIMKLAYIKITNYLENHNVNANIILQVHDEFVIEFEEDCAEKHAKNITKLINSCGKYYSIFIDCDYKITKKNWADK